MVSAREWWMTYGESCTKPNAGLEGFDVRAAVYEALRPFERVLEVGCGIGETAALFSPCEYIGIDINPLAVEKARQRLPGHDFRQHDVGMALPAADAVLFYDVLLHVPDDEINDLLAEAATDARKIVIAEMMDRKWRHGGMPPAFNRNPEDYLEIMRALGFSESRRTVRVCQHYTSQEWAGCGSPDFTLLTLTR